MSTFWADLTLGVATTKASLTAGLMWGTGCPLARLIARASRRKAGFCPDSSAMEDPRMLHCRIACMHALILSTGAVQLCPWQPNEMP